MKPPVFSKERLIFLLHSMLPQYPRIEIARISSEHEGRMTKLHAREQLFLNPSCREYLLVKFCSTVLIRTLAFLNMINRVLSIYKVKDDWLSRICKTSPVRDC
jgi:hypothetical protein